MQKRNNVIFVFGVLLLVMPFLVKGQDSSTSTSSPYSRYGVGALNGYSFGRSEAMGGIGIGIRNNFQVNTGNPASYTAIDSLSFLTEFGLSSKFTSYKTETAKNGSNNVNFDFLAFSFPVKKWWAASFGLLPVSEKGYNIGTTTTTDNSNSTTNFNGTGTLAKVFVGNAFDIGKNLSVGINAWYMFGNLVDQSFITFPDDPAAYDYLNYSTLNIHNFGLTTGIQYHFLTKKKNTLTIGAVFEPKQNLSMEYSIIQERSLFRGSTTQTPVIDTLQNVTTTGKFAYPLSYGFGFSYAIKNKMVIGADYYHQQWSQSSFPGQGPMTNRSRYSAGFELTPDENSLTSYWSRSKFRAGVFYDDSYLVLNDKKINGYGLTFGLGLPFPRSRSSFNISAEIGRLGTTQNNLIQETYAKITLHMLFYDRWFMKRKIE